MKKYILKTTVQKSSITNKQWVTLFVQKSGDSNETRHDTEHRTKTYLIEQGLEWLSAPIRKLLENCYRRSPISMAAIGSELLASIILGRLSRTRCRKPSRLSTRPSRLWVKQLPYEKSKDIDIGLRPTIFVPFDPELKFDLVKCAVLWTASHWRLCHRS